MKMTELPTRSSDVSDQPRVSIPIWLLPKYSKIFMRYVQYRTYFEVFLHFITSGKWPQVSVTISSMYQPTHRNTLGTFDKKQEAFVPVSFIACLILQNCQSPKVACIIF